MKRIFIISVLCTLMGLTKTMAQEAYAVYTSDNTTLTFYYDNQKSSRSGIKYSVPLNQADDDDPAWFSKVGETTTVKFDPSFAGARPTNTNSWFSAMYKLTTITGMEYFNTSQVTSMSYMFSLSRNLRSLDLTHFNTAKVKKMVRMFWGCEKLVTICAGDGWTTNAITNSEEMFTGCHELVGGNGTKYDDMHPLHSRAQIDGKDGYAGYFTSAEYTSLTYNLWVGGIQVTYMNKDDILNTGQAAYNPSTNTLTLKGQYINGKGMLLINNTTITGSAQLTASGDMGVHLGSTSSNLTVSGNVTLEADGTTGGITGYRRTRPFENYYSTLTVKDQATVKAYGLGTLADLVLENHAITYPTDAVWNADQNAVCGATGKPITGKWVWIEYQEPPRADVNQDGTVDSADIVAVIKAMK